MKKIIVAIAPALLCLFLISCQKEVDFANGNGGGGGGGGTTGNTLVKTVSKNGNDSVVTVYTYNGGKLLINQKISGKSQGIDITNEFRYYRNASGVITHFVQINAGLVAQGIDSVTTYVHYDAAASRYTSSVSEFGLFGFTVTDSSVLVYDAGGKVTRIDMYQGSPSIGLPVELTEKTKYTYTANGNIAQFEMFSHDPSTGSDDLISTIKYTYDSKVSAFTPTTAMLNSTEAFVLGFGEWHSVNNNTKFEMVSPLVPAANRSTTIAYTYNSANRPATGVATAIPGNVTDNLTFYYQ